MTKLLILFSLVIAISFSSFGQVDKKYSKTLKKMFELSGSEASYQSVIKQTFSMYKKQYTNVDANIWDELETDFAKTSLDDLTEMLVPVYAKYLTLDDLKQLIKFYKTPIGKKFSESTPLIMEESIKVGQEWGIKIGQNFLEKMKEKGY